MIKAKVIEGTYRKGERLPPQVDMAKEYGVALATFVRALDVLEDGGYVIRRTGEGTFASLPDPSSKAALVIDDDARILRFFGRVLKTHGWECVALGSGLTARETVQSRHFDVAFVDLMMPMMNECMASSGLRTAVMLGHLDQSSPSPNICLKVAWSLR